MTKTYGEKVLFQNISLQISKGQKVALVAQNGSGKTTLLRVIAGQEAPEGEAAKVMPYRDVRIGYLEQEPDFFEGHTILEAVLDSDNDIIQAIRRYEHAMLFPGQAENLQKAMDKTEKAISGKTTEQLESRGIPHAIFGGVNLMDWMWIQAYHELRHLNALKRKRGDA